MINVNMDFETADEITRQNILTVLESKLKDYCESKSKNPNVAHWVEHDDISIINALEKVYNYFCKPDEKICIQMKTDYTPEVRTYSFEIIKKGN